MFIQQLTIEIKSDLDKDNLLDEFLYLLGCYRKSGQSQGDNEIPFIADNFIRCDIPTLEKNSLDKKYNNKWVDSQRKKLEGLCASKLSVATVGKSTVNFDGVCKCKSHDFLVLFTHMFNRASPIDCGTCFNVVPLYKLSKLDSKTMHSILVWEDIYISCDKLQIHSTVGERWATKQMSDFKSGLSKQGLELCAAIKKETGITTYYYLFNYRKISLAKDINRNCPSCGGQWTLKTQLGKFYDFKCDKCKLVSSISPNS
jgi:predicted  nucleic acid-binding Zn ribbon protein